MKCLSAIPLLVWASSLGTSGAFTTTSPIVQRTAKQQQQGSAETILSASTADQEEEVTATAAPELFRRDRYIATNRFAVRQDKQAKFEQRWATRKSSLAKLEGFQYFHLMRRVRLNKEGTVTSYDGGDNKDDAMENYVSFTIWNKKHHFNAWRSGEAFKEAHGGTSIGAFLSTMVSSALVLRGAPRPAFYDGLFLTKTVPTSVPQTVNGWREVEADGVQTLPVECFVVMEKHFILQDMAKEFEDYWSSTKNDLDDDIPSGMVARSVMRRDGQAKGHGIVEMQSNEPTYVVCSIFDSLASYQEWIKARTDEESLPSRFSAKRKPETVFYEGTLVISSPQGA